MNTALGARVIVMRFPEKKAEGTKNEASREHPVPTKTKEAALA